MGLAFLCFGRGSVTSVQRPASRRLSFGAARAGAIGKGCIDVHKPCCEAHMGLCATRDTNWSDHWNSAADALLRLAMTKILVTGDLVEVDATYSNRRSERLFLYVGYIRLY